MGPLRLAVVSGVKWLVCYCALASIMIYLVLKKIQLQVFTTAFHLTCKLHVYSTPIVCHLSFFLNPFICHSVMTFCLVGVPMNNII